MREYFTSDIAHRLDHDTGYRAFPELTLRIAPRRDGAIHKAEEDE
jgi:hypothetical protein